MILILSYDYFIYRYRYSNTNYLNSCDKILLFTHIVNEIDIFNCSLSTAICHIYYKCFKADSFEMFIIDLTTLEFLQVNSCYSEMCTLLCALFKTVQFVHLNISRLATSNGFFFFADVEKMRYL